MRFIKICYQYPHKFNSGHSSSSLIAPFCWGGIDFQETLPGRNGKFCFSWMLMIKAWGRVLFGDMSKNEQIQIIDSQIHFPVIVTP